MPFLPKVIFNTNLYFLFYFRWKSCVSSAGDSFSAAVGKMYVSKHFQEAAKDGMLEMVQDIREEFKIILNEVPR